MLLNNVPLELRWLRPG